MEAESIPQKLQTIEDVIKLIKVVEECQYCSGITEEKYKILIGHTLQKGTIQENPFVIHSNSKFNQRRN